MYVLPVISANTSFAHDSIYIVLTGGFNTLCDMPANTGVWLLLSTNSLGKMRPNRHLDFYRDIAMRPVRSKKQRK